MNIKIISFVGLLVMAGASVWFIKGEQNTANLKAPTESAVTEQTPQELSVTSATDFISVRPAVAALPEQAISNEERDGLIFMREEEKLARDVYSERYPFLKTTILSIIPKLIQRIWQNKATGFQLK